MLGRKVFAVVAAVSATAALLTARGRAGGSAPAAESPSSVVAEVGGRQITREEVEKKAAGRLQQIRQQEYEVLRQTLREMVDDELIAKEAAARHLSKEALVAAEVDAKTTPPTPADIDSLYEQYKPRLGAQPKEQVVPQLEKMLRDRRRGDRLDAFKAELRGKSTVRIALSAPRMEVPVAADAPVLGDKNAPVTIVEFTDYQCPFCHRAQDTVEQVLGQYPGKVRLVAKDFPLDIHPRAIAASRAARCAGEQKKFWEYHRDLLKTATDYSDDDLKKRAAGLGMDVSAFGACIASDRHDAAIKASFDEGQKLGVSGTPTFFVNGVAMVGARPVTDFREQIESELARR
jgi:protein-disulfide isomerase